MDEAFDSRVREALTEMQMYLSDAIAPLVVLDSMEMLLRLPPEVLAAGIHEWVVTQTRREGQTVPVSDYLYHALRKLFLISEFKLVPKEELTAKLDALKPILLDICPPGDRELLQANYARLDEVQTGVAPPVEALHRQFVASAAPLATEARATPAQDLSGSHRLSNLVKQLETVTTAATASLAVASLGAAQGAAPVAPASAPAEGPAPAVPVPPVAPRQRPAGELVTQILVVAAGNQKDPEEFRRVRDYLVGKGADTSTEKIIQMLSESLPGWTVTPPETPVEGKVLPYQPRGVAEALRKIVAVEEDPKEGARRLHEMVRAAVEQMNEGSLGRAATMFDLAERLIAETRLDVLIVQQVRERAHEGIDQNRLRRLAEDPANFPALRRVLSFFPALSPHQLLSSLQTEERRDRRRLVLALLEAHGAGARGEILDRLAASADSLGDSDSYFQRNLLYLLRRIPKNAETPWEPELELICRLSAPGHPVVLVKEAIASLGQIKHERAERTLIARLGEFEAVLSKPTDLAYAPADVISVLDRLAYALAKYGTSATVRALVQHGLRRQAHLGDTAARLSELAGVNLASDPETVDRLLKGLAAELPHKVFGIVIEKSRPRALRIIAALSATPTADVRAALEDIVRRFSDGDVGRAAADALKGLDAAPRSSEPTVKSLSGDLDLFGLPTLLQNLAQSQASGLLVIRNQHAEQIGSLVLEEGKLLLCRVGPLRGDDALYQLLERPEPGTFVFTSPYDSGGDSAVRRDAPEEVVPLIFEGIRRYDELIQAAALVPDDATVTATGTKPTRLAEETDSKFLNALWAKAIGGATALECEAAFPVDAFRVRRMLAHWVDEGSLALR